MIQPMAGLVYYVLDPSRQGMRCKIGFTMTCPTCQQPVADLSYDEVTQTWTAWAEEFPVRSTTTLIYVAQPCGHELAPVPPHLMPN